MACLISVAFFLLLLQTSSSSTLSSDASALLSFKQNLTFLSPSILPSWNSSSVNSICSSWIGVSCSGNSSSLLRRVSSLRLPGQTLRGPIPLGSLGLLDALDTLSLRNNKLSGTLPPDLANCTSLKVLNLLNNNFSGPLLFDFSRWPLLQQIDLSVNNFSGPIPASIGSLNRLNFLNLQNNSFSGAIPSLNIPSLKNLNLSYNQLNGCIPSPLSTMFPPESFSGNTSPLAACPNQSKRKLSTGAIVGIAFGVAVFFLVALLLCFYFLRRRRTTDSRKERKDLFERGRSHFHGPKQEARTSEYGKKRDNSTAPGTEIKERQEENKQLIFIDKSQASFDLEDLLRASAEVLGKGSLGTVYRAGMSDGLVIAVKRIRYGLNGKEQYKQFMEKIGSMKHKNLVPLMAYYVTTQEKLLVFDYMPNGSLSALLHGSPSSERTMLDWDARVGLALDVARGLAYLHSHQLVHGNLKASNVLLTSNGDGCLADYGLVQMVSLPLENIRVAGYMAPEITDLRKITQKGDVYSFGILLLELLTGKNPSKPSMDDQYGVDLPRWVQSVGRKMVFDRELFDYQNNMEEEMIQLLQVALPCVRSSSDQRPTMGEIVKVIENVRKMDEDETSEYFDQYPETVSEFGLQ